MSKKITSDDGMNRAELETQENKLFSDAIKKIMSDNNFQKSKETIGVLISNLEDLYEPQDSHEIIPRCALRKVLCSIKGSIEQYVISTDPEKDKIAGPTLLNLWSTLKLFFTKKVIPPNIYDIGDQCNALTTENEKLKKELKKYEVTLQPGQKP